ncbi:MAG: hypothetical protein HYY91_00360 [Candidatus Omnitrophica bacterium]|nr:hypothetical protein [Candidatus Omnitrophota bacterium]
MKWRHPTPTEFDSSRRRVLGQAGSSTASVASNRSKTVAGSGKPLGASWLIQVHSSPLRGRTACRAGSSQYVRRIRLSARRRRVPSARRYWHSSGVKSQGIR